MALDRLNKLYQQFSTARAFDEALDDPSVLHEAAKKEAAIIADHQLHQQPRIEEIAHRVRRRRQIRRDNSAHLFVLRHRNRMEGPGQEVVVRGPCTRAKLGKALRREYCEMNIAGVLLLPINLEQRRAGAWTLVRDDDVVEKDAVLRYWI